MSKQFVPNDLWKFSCLSWPALSEDGRRCAAVVTHPDQDGTNVGCVRVYDTETGGVLYSSPDGVHETQPKLEKDMLYVLSDASSVWQVWKICPETGKRTQLTFLRHGVTAYDAADGRIVFEAPVYDRDEQQGLVFVPMKEGEEEAFLAWLDREPYVAEDLTYKMDEWFGMRKGFMPRIGVAGDNGAARLLPGTPMEGSAPALSPDGKHAAFFGFPYGGTKGRTAELMCWNTDTDTVVTLSQDDGVEAGEAPVFSEDGSWVYAPAYREFENGASRIVKGFSLHGGEKAVLPDVAEETVCEGAGSSTISRTVREEYRSSYAFCGNDMVFLSSFRGETALCRVSLSFPERVERLESPDEDVSAFAINRKGDLAVIAGNREKPGDLFVRGRQMTDEHAWLREYPQGRTEEVHIPTRDGKSELTYFYTHPVCESGPAPVVLDIKGGPETMYARAYWHEFHALSAAGFGVIHGNPRSSSGYGRAFREGGICWTDDAMYDLLDMCEDAVRRGWADPKHFGVTGGSYGGYMTLKLIGKTDRFAAAAGQRVFANPGTSYGTGDVGWVSAGGRVPEHFSMLRYLENRARGSNVSRVDQIRTPLLLLHGYRDYRCTFEQAEQMFIAMKERHPDVPVRLVMFPNENHALTRTGNMKNQVRHLQEILDWMKRYLQGEGEGGNA